MLLFSIKDGRYDYQLPNFECPFCGSVLAVRSWENHLRKTEKLSENQIRSLKLGEPVNLHTVIDKSNDNKKLS